MESNANDKQYLKCGLVFDSLDDYISIWNIENWLHCLYEINPKYNDECDGNYPNSHFLINNSLFREPEKSFYYNFRDVSNFIDDIKDIAEVQQLLDNCFLR